MDFSLPLSGMRDAEKRLDVVAANIAGSTNVTNIASDSDYKVDATSKSEAPSDKADLSREAVDLLKAKNDFMANVRMAHVEDEIGKSTFSLFA
jgi:flagellar basal body rod protein FlgC